MDRVMVDLSRSIESQLESGFLSRDRLLMSLLLMMVVTELASDGNCRDIRKRGEWSLMVLLVEFFLL